MSFYNILLFIHILAAILGIGPGFVLTFMITNAKTMTELRHGFKLRHRIHLFVMVGATLLFITGLIMGFINPNLFKQGWYLLSIFLFLVVMAAGPLALKPITDPIKKMLREHSTEEIPRDYELQFKKLYWLEHVTNLIILTIIILMILKPF